MKFTTAATLTFSTLLAISLASPGPLPETILLDNGDTSISVTIDGAASERRFALANPASLFARDSVNCKGSKLCNTLGSSCDNAKRKIYGGNTYSTETGASASGVCSGYCGIFVSGNNCKASGKELANAFDKIRGHGCKKCGKYKRDDGCELKIDRVTGCNQ
ncbi:hypothetical protein GGR52DRAFT_573656 [Neofusicoccum parvum]|uniref:Uncharacterized protein n=1 Tax=Neofusicoccum parvum TaxID=310453 RepID=A0ACB5S599_9PEZI|nr:hypothetical protein GGR52DRAFT_573656 [Neofusicoccum parvum]